MLAVPLVGSLVVYHIYLLKTSQTTNEDLNHVYETEENPFQLVFGLSGGSESSTGMCWQCEDHSVL